MTEKQAAELIFIFINIEYLIAFISTIYLCNTLLDSNREEYYDYEVIKVKSILLLMIGIALVLIRIRVLIS